jgi:hypothetical protein
MNRHHRDDCERFDALIASWFDDDITAPDRRALMEHVSTCASCRESFELTSRMEAALVSRRDDVPAVDGFLPALSPAPRPFAHPRLVAAFRTLVSPAGIAIVLVLWSTMLALHYRGQIVSKLGTWSSIDHFTSLLNGMIDPLLGASGQDAFALGIAYAIVGLIILASTGAITLRYIRHS